MQDRSSFLGGVIPLVRSLVRLGRILDVVLVTIRCSWCGGGVLVPSFITVGHSGDDAIGLRLVLLRQCLLFFVLLSVLNLIVDEVVKGGDGTDQTAEVDGHELVVGLDTHGSCQLAVVRWRAVVVNQLDDGFG